MLSPDGRHFLLAVDEGGLKRARIAEVDAAGRISTPQPFFAGAREPSIMDARISPDGRMLAYMSTDSGQPEVFLTRFPSGEGRWQVSTDGGQQPRWAAETGELYFVAGSGPTTRTMSVVQVDSSAGVQVGAPEQLFSRSVTEDGISSLGFSSGGGFDVFPDGQKFVLLREASSGEASPRMILVENWRARLP